MRQQQQPRPCRERARRRHGASRALRASNTARGLKNAVCSPSTCPPVRNCDSSTRPAVVLAPSRLQDSKPLHPRKFLMRMLTNLRAIYLTTQQVGADRTRQPTAAPRDRSQMRGERAGPGQQPMRQLLPCGMWVHHVPLTPSTHTHPSHARCSSSSRPPRWTWPCQSSS